MDKPRPSLGSLRSETRRAYVKVAADTVWDMLQESRVTNASLRQVIAIRNNDVYVGCAESNAESWLTKYSSMYAVRRKLAFKQMCHINVVLDPSHHGK